MVTLRLVLAGATINNGNLGVQALARSVANAVNVAVPGSGLTILDDGWGVRAESSDRYPDITVEMAGVRRSRRLHRPESWTRVRLALLRGGGRNPVAQRMAAADAVLDISGGDSFTDMYGPTRLRTICLPKLAAMQARRPLVLLPQTIGPFDTRPGREMAQRVVRAATLIYTRDQTSHDRLLELTGNAVEASRLRRGVDVAFALATAVPRPEVRALVDQLSAQGNPLAGVNVSGLLVLPGATQQFGLAGDYLATMTELVRRLIRQDVTVVLLSHVYGGGGRGESDKVAIDALLARLDDPERGQVVVLPMDMDASETKWCVGQMDWFVGSRMHSTIAGLSSLVPTFGYAYSDKTEGVFKTCGMSSQVADARGVSGEEAVQLMLHSFSQRGRTAVELNDHVPAINQQALTQLVDLFVELQNASRSGGSR
ncbi:MAG: polysaccharide pyruvyl transferase family protein [Brooklawnia sp.]|jgi:colanic acid/amylovoran biosynthesis protein